MLMMFCFWIFGLGVIGFFEELCGMYFGVVLVMGRFSLILGFCWSVVFGG